MMTAAATVTSRFEMGRVVSRTFGVIGRNFVVFLLLALVLAGIPQAITRYFAQTQAAASFSLTHSLLSFAFVIIGFMALSVLQVALVYGSIADLNGKKASVGDCLATGMRFLWPVIGVSLLTGIAVGFGFLLLIVPGVLMGLAWCMNVPAVVVERKGVMEAFGRSADLTRGHRAAIFGLVVVYVLIVWIIDAVAIALTGGLSFAALAQGQNSFNGVEWVLMTVLQVVQSLIGAAGLASIYFELRSTKEGVGVESLASVFD
jgi:hypothetical protein